MAAKRNRYREMERYLTAILIADAVLFLLFLLYSGLGIIWGKVLAAILVVLMSGLSLGFLYLTGELMRRRSLWMSAGFAAIALCLVVSLICNYPSPSKTKAANAPAPL